MTRENRFGGLDLLRLAIPRRVYTDNHMDVIAVALKNVYDRRESITRGVKIVWEAELMRHFTVQLELWDNFLFPAKVGVCYEIMNELCRLEFMNSSRFFAVNKCCRGCNIAVIA